MKCITVVPSIFMTKDVKRELKLFGKKRKKSMVIKGTIACKATTARYKSHKSWKVLSKCASFSLPQKFITAGFDWRDRSAHEHNLNCRNIWTRGEKIWDKKTHTVEIRSQ